MLFSLGAAFLTVATGTSYSPSFVCVSGGSLPGFFIGAHADLLAGATLDPAATTYQTSLFPCATLTEPQSAILAFVSGPQQGACYVGCRYGTGAYALQLYMQQYPDLNAERASDNIFATATSSVSLTQKMQWLTGGLCMSSCPLAAW